MPRHVPLASDSIAPQKDGVFSEFWEFVGDFQTITAWIAKAAVVAPLADIILNIGPPWPSRLAVSILLCIFEILVLMYAFEFWRRGNPAVKNIRRAMLLLLFFFIPAILVYLFLFAQFIVDAPDAWSRVVIGYTFHEDIGLLVASDPTLYTPTELLKQFHDEASVWTTPSISVMRVAVLLAWLGVWTSLSIIIAAFVALQWRRK